MPQILTAVAVIALLFGGQAQSSQVAAVQPQNQETGDTSDGAKIQLEDALRSLKNTKRAGRVEAERALATIDAFREARRNRQPPQPLDAQLPLCIANPSSECLLQEALAHAYRVPDEARRDWALSAVASAYFEVGAPGRVYSVVALMEDPRTALRLLEQTIGAGEPSSAADKQDTTGLSSSENDMTAKWMPFAQAGDWLAAEKGIEEIAEARYRAVAWARLGRMAVDAGETDLAERALKNCDTLIDGIELSYARSFAQYEASLTHIVRVARSNGGEAETRNVAARAAQIDQPHFRADAFWRLAGVGSESLAKEIRSRAEESFADIASSLRQVFVLTTDEKKSDERRNRALSIATKISDPLDRSRAFTRLARFIR